MFPYSNILLTILIKSQKPFDKICFISVWLGFDESTIFFTLNSYFKNIGRANLYLINCLVPIRKYLANKEFKMLKDFSYKTIKIISLIR